jgi:hypothetical protein
VSVPPTVQRVLTGGGAATAAAAVAVATSPARAGIVLVAGTVSVSLVVLGWVFARYSVVAAGAGLLGAAWCLARLGTDTSPMASVAMAIAVLAVLEVGAVSSLRRESAVALGLGGATSGLVAGAAGLHLTGSGPAVVAAMAAVAVVWWPVRELVRVAAR